MKEEMARAHGCAAPAPSRNERRCCSAQPSSSSMPDQLRPAARVSTTTGSTARSPRMAPTRASARRVARRAQRLERRLSSATQRPALVAEPRGGAVRIPRPSRWCRPRSAVPRVAGPRAVWREARSRRRRRLAGRYRLDPLGPGPSGRPPPAPGQRRSWKGVESAPRAGRRAPDRRGRARVERRVGQAAVGIRRERRVSATAARRRRRAPRGAGRWWSRRCSVAQVEPQRQARGGGLADLSPALPSLAPRRGGRGRRWWRASSAPWRRAWSAASSSELAHVTRPSPRPPSGPRPARWGAPGKPAHPGHPCRSSTGRCRS